MKKFILKLIKFITIVLLIKVILFIPVLLSLKSLDISFLGKQTNKSRIILVGSSNLGYNYDYELLNKHFKNYNIVGCNLNEPSGVFPTLFKLKQLNTTPDDIIIFCFPHSFYEEDKHFPLEDFRKRGASTETLLHYIKEYPIKFLTKFFHHNTIDSYKLLINRRKSKKSSSFVFKEQPKIATDSLYNSCWVNPELNSTIKSITYEKEYIKQLLQYTSSKFNGNIYFRFPAIRKNDYNININRLSFLKETGFFINDFNSSIYNHKYWFDQWYHLNKCGRDLSTEKLIHEIERCNIVK